MEAEVVRAVRRERAGVRREAFVYIFFFFLVGLVVLASACLVDVMLIRVELGGVNRVYRYAA